jgi:pimeloyl-ACP methyl ester carboxylesterase
MTNENTRQHPNKTFFRRVIQIMLIISAVLLGIVFILAGVLVVYSPGNPQPYLDENGNQLPGSLSEKIFVNINGTREGMFIQTKDFTHPVLLYLHGGMPDYFLRQKYPTRLEDDFTVVWWEQRGSGISYSDDIPRETMTQEQMISDTLAVTEYLRKRFGQEKIYLMGHSGGSFIGIQAAAQKPQYYHAYLGVAQMSNQLASEKLAYDYMLAKFKADGNSDMVRKLEATPITMEGGIPKGYNLLRDVAMHSLGIGTTHDMDSVITGIMLPSFSSREYTFMEKVNMWRGKARAGISILLDRMLATDLSKQVPELAIPVYFFEGIYDYTCSYSVAKSYFENLKAPLKGFYTFENSAHSPFFEEPEKMQRILQTDILKGTNNLADIK